MHLRFKLLIVASVTWYKSERILIPFQKNEKPTRARTWGRWGWNNGVKADVGSQHSCLCSHLCQPLHKSKYPAFPLQRVLTWTFVLLYWNSLHGPGVDLIFLTTTGGGEFQLAGNTRHTLSRVSRICFKGANNVLLKCSVSEHFLKKLGKVLLEK